MWSLWCSFLGLVGNFIGLIVFARKSIDKNIKTKPIYQALLFIDSIYLSSQVVQDSLDSFRINIGRMSTATCKLKNLGLKQKKNSSVSCCYNIALAI